MTGAQAVIAILAVCAVAAAVAWFEAYCLADLSRATEVRYFTRQMWALLILITMPLGGLLYLRYGRVR